ncbi:AraC family transcriptional regulator [Paenibacillus sp. L3-i20]|uniref:helix-turn-helix transcriptional regulator n=1 Tax=Paenibacillus sp. L3-i20 TaxID=2905833 RepID=UPI001EDD2057|nr:AraC family transcriptional regulator [Paenibacillus sp. L3-i20]GKU76102.1 AraC family transcriptional regulator [Paenibacillus sp. L3-i20]
MDTRGIKFPRLRSAPFHEWSPSIHYAQYQRMPTGPLLERRIYDFELLYVSQGEAAITMLGQRFTLTAGQLIFLPSGVYHQNEAISGPDTRFLGIHFDFFDEIDIQTESDIIVNEKNVQNDRFACEAVSDTFQPLSLHPVYTPTLACVQLMEQLVHEFTMRPLGYELVCKAHMLNILAHLLRHANSRRQFLTSQHDNKLLKLIEMIDKSPSDPWTNTLIAERMNLSIDHTAKLFKQLVGLPPNEYIHAARHREARRLLRETDMSIERISEEIGYSGIHYFSRLFRKHEGISATEYRKLTKVL